MLVKRDRIIEAKTATFSLTGPEKADLLKKCEKRKIFTGTRSTQEDAKKLVVADFKAATNVYIEPGVLKRLLKVTLNAYDRMGPDDARYKVVEKTIKSIRAEMEYQAKIKSVSRESSLEEKKKKRFHKEEEQEEDSTVGSDMCHVEEEEHRLVYRVTKVIKMHHDNHMPNQQPVYTAPPPATGIRTVIRSPPADANQGDFAKTAKLPMNL